jgi:hypothetical protein
VNVELLRKIQKHITEEPRRLQMGGVIEHMNPGVEFCEHRAKFVVPKCGTVACIAGWAFILSGEGEVESDRQGYVMLRAEELLGLTSGEGDRLFLEDWWPDLYLERWEAAETAQERARIAVKRIDHFIKTDGAE